MKITKEEWCKIGKNYKCIIDGVKYIMKNMQLIPVEIVK